MLPATPQGLTPEELLARLRARHPEGHAIANTVQLVRDGSFDWFLHNTTARLKQMAADFVLQHPEVAPGQGPWMAAMAREHFRRIANLPPGARVGTGW